MERLFCKKQKRSDSSINTSWSPSLIIVRVELHSARTGKITELARMKIVNVGGTDSRGDYEFVTYRGRSKKDLDKEIVERLGSIEGYPRLRLHVWNLVARALNKMVYR